MKIKMEMGDVKIEVEQVGSEIITDLIKVIENTAIQLCGIYQEKVSMGEAWEDGENDHFGREVKEPFSMDDIEFIQTKLTKLKREKAGVVYGSDGIEEGMEDRPKIGFNCTKCKTLNENDILQCMGSGENTNIKCHNCFAKHSVQMVKGDRLILEYIGG